MEEQKGLAVVSEERSVADVKTQVGKIQNLMKEIMILDEHYGIIPGTGKKPSLLKAGAEKLCFVFRLAPEFEVFRDDLPAGHREYRITCRLRSMASGQIVGEGVGSCSTMEAKYRYRNASDYEILDEPIPKDAKERKAEYRKQGLGMKSIDGSWYWVRYTSEGKVENPDLADTYNTVLKMAKKRAHVDATITACAASDIFTQDIEDMAPADPEQPASPEPRKAENKKPAEPKPPTSEKPKPPAPEKPEVAEWNRLHDEMAEIMKSKIDGVAAFREEDQEKYRARYSAAKARHDVAALREIVNNAKAAFDALSEPCWHGTASSGQREDLDLY